MKMEKKEEFRVFLDPPAAKKLRELVEDEDTVYRNASEAIRDILYDALSVRKK